LSKIYIYTQAYRCAILAHLSLSLLVANNRSCHSFKHKTSHCGLFFFFFKFFFWGFWKRGCFPKRSDLIDPDLSVDIGVGGLRTLFFFFVFVFTSAHEFLYPLLVTGRADIRKKERGGY
jgi:hypothetical protein